MDIATDDSLEIKAGIPADAVLTHAELMRAFEEFKHANDQRLAEKRSADVLLEEKLARLDETINTQAQRLEALELKQARPVLAGEHETNHKRAEAGIEHKAAFEAYVRSGEAVNLRALELKALSEGSNPSRRRSCQ